MKKLFILFLILLLPLTSAAGWEDVIDPNGYIDTYTTNLGIDQTAEEMTGGGGNPISQVTDPTIAFINDNFLVGTPLEGYGFIVLYTGTLLAASIFLPSVLGFLIFSYIGYIIGKFYNLEFTFFLMIALGIVGSILMWKATHKGDKTKKWRKISLVLLIIFIFTIIGLAALNILGIQLAI